MPVNIRDWLPVLFCGLSIPLSLFMWLGNLTISKLWTNEFEAHSNPYRPIFLKYVGQMIQCWVVFFIWWIFIALGPHLERLCDAMSVPTSNWGSWLNQTLFFNIIFCRTLSTVNERIITVILPLFSWFVSSHIHKYLELESAVIPPTRWLFSILAPLTLMIVALKRKSVSHSGAALGIVVAFILSIASHAFFFSLAAFFFTSSRATKFRSHMKRKIEKDFKEGEGQRNWVQVLCNSGMATQLAILYLIDVGSGERTIDFVNDYRASWLGIAVMSVFASCNGDTWASELGSVLSKSDPYLITSFRKVPRGTNGGVSLIGLLVSFVAGVVVGLTYYITVCLTASTHMQLVGPTQWPLILWGGIAGLFGSVVDSLLGATLQYSGIDEEGKIVDTPDKGVRYISGLRIIDNHSVNLISSILTGVCMPILAMKYWPER